MQLFKNSAAARRIVTLVGVTALISGSAFATAIGTGEANTAGTLLVNSSGIFFSNFTAPGPNTGAFATTTAVTQGNLVGAPTLTPNLTDWATFTTSTGTIMFDLQTISPGYGTSAGCSSNTVGSECTPSANSGITLTQVTDSSVAISLVGHGISYLGTSASGSSPTVVSFSSQNNVPGTITAILAEVVSGTGFTNSVSATYDTSSAVPEPATLTMMGLGLLGLGLIGRRKHKA